MKPPSKAAVLLGKFVSDPARQDMLFAIANQVLVSGVTFLIGIAAARILGVAEFGKLVIAMILQMLAQSIQGCFVISPMMVLAGRRAARTGRYFSAVLVWNAILSTASGAAVALVFVALYGYRDGVIPVELCAAAAAFTATQNFLVTIRRMLFAQRRGLQAFLLDAGRYALLALSVIVVWGWWGQFDVVTILWLLAATAVVATIAVWPSLERGRINARLIRTVWVRHWPFAQWLALMILLTFGQEHAITLSLGAVMNDEAVGGLRAGQYLLGVTHFILVALENFVPANASRAYTSGGIPALRSYLRETTLIFGAPTLGFILLVAVPAESTLRIVFGAGYEQFAPILRIYAITYAISFFREIWVFYFIATERTDVIFRAFGFSFLVAAAAVYPAISTWGVPGAAAVVLLASAISTSYILYRVWRHSKASDLANPGANSTPKTANA